MCEVWESFGLTHTAKKNVRSTLLQVQTWLKFDLSKMELLSAYYLIPICHQLALLGAHHILHVNGVRVNKN